MEGPLLKVESLRTYFAMPEGVLRAVDGVDFEVNRQETVCVVGESGSGKSVTALSVMGLIRRPGRIQTGSKVLFRGRDLTQMPDAELRQIRGNEIAMIFQEPMTSLNPVFTVGEQIAEAIRLHQRVGSKEATDRAVELMRQVGIPSPEKRSRHYPHQMSGGQRQRVMIAMALSCNPALLIADEPTTALDVTIQAQILELMTELRERLGTAILFITHNLGVVAEMADRVVVMYAGRVAEQGPVEDIFNRPQHPYTEALLGSMPTLGMDQSKQLRVIRGVVPSALNWPQGCRFAPRCDLAFDRCTREVPPLMAAGRQRAACWLCEAGPRDPARVEEAIR
jgi:oligopeptide/dipeptide ABC transporter ATP-binding protein